MRESSHEEMLIAAVDQCPLPVLMTDLKPSILYVNSAFTEHTGYGLAEVAGKNPSLLQSGSTPRQVYRELWASLNEGRVWRGELLNRKKDGSSYWERICIAPVKNAEGKVCHYLGVWMDVTEEKFYDNLTRSHTLLLERESLTDELTNLPNRRAVLVELDREIERASRYERRLSALAIDIDGFQALDRRLGRMASDLLLHDMAQRLQFSIRRIDRLGRYGADEFWAILPEAGLEEALTVSERLQKEIAAAPFYVKDETISLTVCTGVVQLTDCRKLDRSVAAGRIEKALLKAKSKGRGSTAVE